MTCRLTRALCHPFCATCSRRPHAPEDSATGLHSDLPQRHHRWGRSVCAATWPEPHRTVPPKPSAPLAHRRTGRVAPPAHRRVDAIGPPAERRRPRHHHGPSRADSPLAAGSHTPSSRAATSLHEGKGTPSTPLPLLTRPIGLAWAEWTRSNRKTRGKKKGST